MKRLFILSLFTAVGLLFVPANTTLAAPSTTLVITEVQTHGLGGLSQEFVELFNQSNAPVNITGWQVKYAAATSTSFTAKATLSGTVAAHSFVLLSTSDYLPDAAVLTSGLADAGGHLVLVDNTGVEIDRIGWGTAASPEGSAVSATGLAAGQSLQREIDTAAFFPDTDNNAVDFVVSAPSPQTGTLASEPEEEEPEPVPPVEEPTEPSVPPCMGVVLSEIGGNFVELYNPTAAALPLESCQLLIDGTIHGFDPGSTLEAGQYLAVPFDIDLSGLGAVTLVTTVGNVEVSYPSLASGQAWISLDGLWRLTLQQTSGSANVLAQQPEEPPLPEPTPEPEPVPPTPVPQPQPQTPAPSRLCKHHPKSPRPPAQPPVSPPRSQQKPSFNRPAPAKFVHYFANPKSRH